MVVQHNLTAMNANRMLGITTNSQAKATEKLSSGYKINRAADDAAGLSISEKMRKQIRGLTRASQNAEDGISCVQTAEGALTEVHAMLQRMNELAVQASNGTQTEEDRSSIQAEIDQLCSEIDRVSETTEFNELSLLKGDSGAGTKTVSSVVSPLTVAYKDKNVVIDKEIGYASDLASDSFVSDAKKLGTYNSGIYAKNAAGSNEATLKDVLDQLELDENGELKFKEGAEFYKQEADTTDTEKIGDQRELITIDDVKDAFIIKTGALMDSDSKIVADSDLSNYFDKTGGYKGGLHQYAPSENSFVEVGAEKLSNYVTIKAEHSETAEVNEAFTLNFQVGAMGNSANKISVSIEEMSSKSLGLIDLKVDGPDSTNADNAINRVKEAIKKVSRQRSDLGAIQNRLEHTIANLDNVVENTTAAESAIRDTDMAESMVEYSKNQILAQAGQSMLAQANSATQGVLSLLQ